MVHVTNNSHQAILPSEDAVFFRPAGRVSHKRASGALEARSHDPE